MSGRLQVVALTCLVAGCGGTELQVRTQSAVCPAEAPHPLCPEDFDLDQPEYLNELKIWASEARDALRSCKAEFRLWRDGYERCVRLSK